MLSREHRKLLVFEQGIIALLINIVINGGIAWLIFRSASQIPLWGESSAGVDMIATALLLPLFSCLIVSKLVGNQVRKGKIPPLPTHQIPASGWSHRSAVIRGFFLGGCAILLGATPVVAALSIADSASFETTTFIGYKAVWAGVMAGTVSPLIAWWALSDASRSHVP